MFQTDLFALTRRNYGKTKEIRLYTDTATKDGRRMTENEAKDFIQGKLDCMKKCGIFNKEDNVSGKDCDNCDYCYSQGNFGEQKNAFEMAIKALEEVQQYRSR